MHFWQKAPGVNGKIWIVSETDKTADIWKTKFDANLSVKAQPN